MPKATGKEANDRQRLLGLAAVVSHRVQITDIRLVQGDFWNGGVDPENPGPIRIKYNTQAVLDRDKSSVSVVFNGTVESDSQGSELELDSSLRIVATFAASYTVDSTVGIEDEHLDAFGRLNGLFNIWPYFREFVQSTTTRMCLPPLTLPVQHPARPVAQAIPQHASDHATPDKKSRKRITKRGRG